jgi:hypothetical protein
VRRKGDGFQHFGRFRHPALHRTAANRNSNPTEISARMTACSADRLQSSSRSPGNFPLTFFDY